MKKTLIIILLILIVCMFGVIETMRYINRSDTIWMGGHIQTSPDEKWAVYIKSNDTFNLEPSCKIMVFDTERYPELKVNGTFPTEKQENNPTACFIVPIPFEPRPTKFHWDSRGELVHLIIGNEEGEVLHYVIDFKSFSFYKFQKNK